jgi:hypothetical protein
MSTPPSTKKKKTLLGKLHKKSSSSGDGGGGGSRDDVTTSSPNSSDSDSERETKGPKLVLNQKAQLFSSIKQQQELYYQSDYSSSLDASPRPKKQANVPSTVPRSNNNDEPSLNYQVQQHSRILEIMREDIQINSLAIDRIMIELQKRDLNERDEEGDLIDSLCCLTNKCVLL